MPRKRDRHTAKKRPEPPPAIPREETEEERRELIRRLRRKKKKPEPGVCLADRIMVQRKIVEENKRRQDEGAYYNMSLGSLTMSELDNAETRSRTDEIHNGVYQDTMLSTVAEERAVEYREVEYREMEYRDTSETTVSVNASPARLTPVESGSTADFGPKEPAYSDIIGGCTVQMIDGTVHHISNRRIRSSSTMRTRCVDLRKTKSSFGIDLMKTYPNESSTAEPESLDMETEPEVKAESEVKAEPEVRMSSAVPKTRIRMNEQTTYAGQGNNYQYRSYAEIYELHPEHRPRTAVIPTRDNVLVRRIKSATPKFAGLRNEIETSRVVAGKNEVVLNFNQNTSQRSSEHVTVEVHNSNVSDNASAKTVVFVGNTNDSLIKDKEHQRLNFEFKTKDTEETDTVLILESKNKDSVILEEKGNDSVTLGSTCSVSVALESKGDDSVTLESKCNDSVTLGFKTNETVAVESKSKDSFTLESKGDDSITPESNRKDSVSLESKGDDSVTLESKTNESVAVESKSCDSVILEDRDKDSVTLESQGSVSVTLATNANDPVTLENKSKDSVTLESKDNASITAEDKSNDGVTAEIKDNSALAETAVGVVVASETGSNDEQTVELSVNSTEIRSEGSSAEEYKVVTESSGETQGVDVSVDAESVTEGRHETQGGVTLNAEDDAAEADGLSLSDEAGETDNGSKDTLTLDNSGVGSEEVTEQSEGTHVQREGTDVKEAVTLSMESGAKESAEETETISLSAEISVTSESTENVIETVEGTDTISLAAEISVTTQDRENVTEAEVKINEKTFIQESVKEGTSTEQDSTNETEQTDSAVGSDTKETTDKGVEKDEFALGVDVNGDSDLNVEVDSVETDCTSVEAEIVLAKDEGEHDEVEEENASESSLDKVKEHVVNEQNAEEVEISKTEAVVFAGNSEVDVNVHGTDDEPMLANPQEGTGVADAAVTPGVTGKADEPLEEAESPPGDAGAGTTENEGASGEAEVENEEKDATDKDKSKSDGQTDKEEAPESETTQDDIDASPDVKTKRTSLSAQNLSSGKKSPDLKRPSSQPGLSVPKKAQRNSSLDTKAMEKLIEDMEKKLDEDLSSLIDRKPKKPVPAWQREEEREKNKETMKKILNNEYFQDDEDDDLIQKFMT